MDNLYIHSICIIYYYLYIIYLKRSFIVRTMTFKVNSDVHDEMVNAVPAVPVKDQQVAVAMATELSCCCQHMAQSSTASLVPLTASYCQFPLTFWFLAFAVLYLHRILNYLLFVLMLCFPPPESILSLFMLWKKVWHWFLRRWSNVTRCTLLSVSHYHCSSLEIFSMQQSNFYFVLWW